MKLKLTSLSKSPVGVKPSAVAAASGLVNPADLNRAASAAFKDFRTQTQKLSAGSRAPTHTIIDNAGSSEDNSSEDTGVYHFRAVYPIGTMIDVVNFARFLKEFPEGGGLMVSKEGLALQIRMEIN